MPYCESFLLTAIQLSSTHMEAGDGGPFGALIVKDDQIVAHGWNCVTSTNDPTAHAEIMAIREACRHLDTFTLDGCDIYASCEPCPMCLSAIYWARLDSLYFAASRNDAAAAGFDDNTLYQQVALGWQQRQLASEQHLQSAAQAVLTRWQHKPGHIHY